MNAMKTFTAGAVALALSFSVAKAADIVETAVAAGSFNTLVTAVKAAGLVDILKGPISRCLRRQTRRSPSSPVVPWKICSGPKTSSNSL